MKDRPGKLSLCVSRKNSFVSAEEATNHRAMVKGVRVFLERLHQLRQCAVMNNDMVLALSEVTYQEKILPQEPPIVMLHHEPATPTPPVPPRPPPATPTRPIPVDWSWTNDTTPGGSMGDQGAAVMPKVTRGNKIRIDFSFFLNLADKTHTWPLGAIAELIHNSADADAKEVRVSLDDLGPDKDSNFVVIDNGTGLTHSGMAQLFSVGKDYRHHSTSSSGERIGCNGVGFKQGVLRLGNTATVISVCGKQPTPGLPLEDIPTVSFGILSIQDFRRSGSPVVVEYATLNLATMQADIRHNTPEEFDRVMDVIRRLVPYFTREYLVAYAARFVVHTDGSAWDVCGVKSSTSIFVSKLRPSPVCHNGRHKLELIRDSEGSDILLEDHEGKQFRLPHRPASSNEEGKMRPPMDYSLRRFCEQMFLYPRMKIYVQGSEVNAYGLLSPPCDMKDYTFNIDRYLDISDVTFSQQHRPLPYKVTIQVVQDDWHRKHGLSGIMVYFENCLVDSYSRGKGDGLPFVVPPEESGYLAIVSFRGPADKRLFHPNPTKVGFPDDNAKYAYVTKSAAEALTQVIQNVPGTMMVPEPENVDNSIQCSVCSKWRKVTREYSIVVQSFDGWHCGVEGSPVPSPANGSCKCDTPEDVFGGDILSYTPATLVTRTEAPREVLPKSFSFDEHNPLGTGSSACVYVGGGIEGDDTALKVFESRRMWMREKDILWALQETGGSHRHVCRLAWVCEAKLTLALKPVRSRPLATYMDHNESDHVLTNYQRLGIVEKVADALQFLHGNKFAHNDVQPSNIVLGEHSKDEVLLVDFGQACKFSRTGQELRTIFNEFDPSLRYAPPEVLDQTPAAIGGERDIFSFGVIVVELFSEQPMFAPEALEYEAKLKESLETLRGMGDPTRVTSQKLKKLLPGLTNMTKLPGMKELATMCKACVTGDRTRRLKAKEVFQKITKFKGRASFNWRHGSSIVYHTLEPGDKLEFSAQGRFVGLTRLPRTKGPISRETHIRTGSGFGFRSRFISCSLNFSFCAFYAQKQNSMFNNKGFGLAPILEIDLAKLDCDDFEQHVIDGTRQGRAYSSMSMTEKFTADADEIILDIKVPGSAIRAVYNLDYNRRQGESKADHKQRAGHLVELHKYTSTYAFDSSSPFGTWEKHYNKLIRQKGEDGASHQQRIKDQARVPGTIKDRGTFLKDSFCARRDKSKGGLSSRRGNSGGGDIRGGTGGGRDDEGGSATHMLASRVEPAPKRIKDGSESK